MEKSRRFGIINYRDTIRKASEKKIGKILILTVDKSSH